jgi:putative transposase
MHLQRSHDGSASTIVVIVSHRAHMLGGMLVRYRYRIDPTGAQRRALARAFGCARVVDNDALAERRRAYLAGEKLSDTELQRRVVTLAKTRPERAWLAEVASVALVQACQDARRAYRNWFDSRSGSRKGRRVGRPRFRTKHGRQSIRLTRNGFALHGTRLSVAKVGELRVRWSRALPSVPSSVTVLREPDGRCSASVVSVATRPRWRRWPGPPGSTSAWPGWLWSWPATAPSSRSPTRGTCAPPSGNSPAPSGGWPASARGRPTAPRPHMRVAAVHRKVRDRRADHHHKLALGLIRENQVVAVEGLCVAGLGRTRLATSVHDAGWATFVRLLEDTAAQHGRRVVRIGRWAPTSQPCSACRHRDGPKPLGIRAWACPACGVVQDRDANAARNIVVAAGLAETQTACGGSVSPGQPLAVAGEAGTRRGAA